MKVAIVQSSNGGVERVFKTKKKAIEYLKSQGLKCFDGTFWAETKDDVNEYDSWIDVREVEN